ncbi:Plastidal glycolate/glycerate translocator 1, chloroplastic [Cyberlindnera fabianii]|uniref:Plastidal glycolate/glycerate translocator 1, chloroplastic n=1 Tax=Cyberlindnera fabianii TaxID=36022 RepID=A0A1V2L2E0_CYBFA|nr:Plastidal glycolate/glycerate translocator 1, chloroplastic [Cyberlindnera fabianii]
MTSYGLISDLLRGISIGIGLSYPKIIHNYIKVPIGILCVLTVIYAFNQALDLVRFPASVACMILCWLLLIASSFTFGTRRTGILVKFFDIPGKFCLQWISVFFTPAFITLPLSTPISAKEAMLIAAVFIVGFAVQMGGVAYICVGLQWITRQIVSSRVVDGNNILYQTPAFQRDMLIGKWIHRNFDYIVFGVGFIISIPIYFSIGYAMPFHLFTSVITFLIMLHAPPARYRIILNPVLCSVAISWLVYYIFSAIRGVSFLDDLRQYKTGRTYLTLFHVPHTDKITSAPGAGDILTSLMDVAIVSLAMPIYAYRADLWRNAIVLLPTILVMTFGSFFIYPPICHIIGISPERSLAFAGRSITLALGTPFTEALAAMSSVCFVLYGTFMVAMASIPPLVHSLRHIVGLGN